MTVIKGLNVGSGVLCHLIEDSVTRTENYNIVWENLWIPHVIVIIVWVMDCFVLWNFLVALKPFLKIIVLGLLSFR